VLTVAPGKIPNFEANCAKFWTEHLHKEEEIRFIIEGVGK
jgi:1,2-dihydroxy-3-keto-5-methylthiopentene dioxygenase